MPAIDDARAGRAAFTHPGFVLFQIARFLIVSAVEMQAVAVGWQIYEITRRPLDLGYVGLAQFIPVIALFLVAGHVVDRFNRKTVLLLCTLGMAICSALLIEITRIGVPSVGPIYAVLFLLGVVRVFNGPAGRSLLPLLVPDDVFPNAVAWNATVFQAATILGPALGGVLYAAFRGPAGVYATTVVTCLLATVTLTRIHLRPSNRVRE